MKAIEGTEVTQKPQKEKTYKREAASVLLFVYFAAWFWGIWSPEAAVAAESVKYPVFTFAAGAFAIDAVFKQGQR